MTITRKQLEEALLTSYSLRFEHKVLKNADGTSVRARQNGKIKIWIRDPAAFRVPCKHGLKNYLYIDNENANEWRIV